MSVQQVRQSIVSGLIGIVLGALGSGLGMSVTIGQGQARLEEQMTAVRERITRIENVLSTHTSVGDVRR